MVIKTCAIIPALNEERHIAEVVKATKKYVDMVIVADNCSNDKTYDRAKQAGAVIWSCLNRGLGNNLRSGIDRGRVSKHNFDTFIFLDGDGQHNPAEIPNLLKPIQENKADVVMGNRRIQRGMPPYRLFGNGILTAFANWHSRKQFADSMSGFWAIRKEALPELSEKGWGIYTELLIKVRSNGHRLVSVPVQPIYHERYQDNSTLPPFKLGIRLLFFILKWRFICEVLKRGSH